MRFIITFFIMVSLVSNSYASEVIRYSNDTQAGVSLTPLQQPIKLRNTITVESIAKTYAHIVVTSGRPNPMNTEAKLAEAIATEMYALNSQESLNRLIEQFRVPELRMAHIKRFLDGYDRVFVNYEGMESQCLNCY